MAQPTIHKPFTSLFLLLLVILPVALGFPVGNPNNAVELAKRQGGQCSVVHTTEGDYTETITRCSTPTSVEVVPRPVTTTRGEGPSPTSTSGRDDNSTNFPWPEYIRRTYGEEVSVPEGVIGSILVVLGVYFMVFGYRAFRPTLAAVGFMVFSILTYIGLCNAEPAWGYHNSPVVYLCVSIGIGLLGAGVFMFFWKIAVYFVGGLFGFLLGFWVLSWTESHLVTSQVARVCILLGFFLAGMAIAFFNEVYVITVATSFTGAFLFIAGLDLFVRGGFINAIRDILDGNKYHEIYYQLGWQVYTMLAAVLVLCGLSIAWQIWWNKGMKFGVPWVKK